MSDSLQTRTHRLAGALGGEVEGVELSAQLDAEKVQQIKAAFHEHLVLVFPSQDITPAQQVAFTSLFGPVEPHPLASRKGVEGRPEVLVLENKKGTPGARNDFWHSDISFSPTPPAASVLCGRTITPGYGDTMFCNMYQAYDELSGRMRKLVDGLTAMHTSAALVERNQSAVSDGLPIPDVPPPSEHPAVRTHPETGRKALYVNPYFTSHFKGMTVEESRPLLEYLYQRAARPENVYRHHWRQGDLLIWDNRCAMHYAVYDYDDTKPRLMHRTTAGGDAPA
jgi:taurine dioxygenase